MKTFKKFLFLLTFQEQKVALLLLLMITIMALLDMIGVASILPFMAVITNPSIVETNSLLNTMFHVSSKFGVQSNEQFIFVFGSIVFLLLIISITFKVITIYTQIRFVQMREYSIGKRLIEGYLHQPYSWFLSRHSADLGKNILSEVQQVISEGINPLIDLIAKSIVAITLITLLVIIDPKLAFTVGLSLGAVYFCIFYFVRNHLFRAGQERLKNNQLRFTAVSEAFAAVKEIKVGGLEKTFIKSFSNSAKTFAKVQAFSKVISQVPRFILEAVTFGGVLLIILYMISQTGSFNKAIPIITLYVFAGYRLMPALQQIYSSFTQLTFIGPSLNKLYNDLKNIRSLNKHQDFVSLPFKKNIVLNNINYSYPNSSRKALENISFNIPAKSTVGIIGSTGSGKTTIVDIILGILDAQKGTLEVDGCVINKKNIKSWQSALGYVPQHIYLSDDSVVANIAFGVEPKNIDYDLVKKASKISNIYDFIIDELPKQFDTSIGENGVRLSGGQRQRIGIARALYHNPSVLILDEATSALDNETEQSVMKAINNLSKNICVILIAHRLNTVKACDIIYKLDKGQLVKQGKFDEVVTNFEDFDYSKKNV